MRQVEFDDLKKPLSNINDFNFSKELTETFNPIHNAEGHNRDNFDIKITHHKLEKEKNFEMWTAQSQRRFNGIHRFS